MISLIDGNQASRRVPLVSRSIGQTSAAGQLIEIIERKRIAPQSRQGLGPVAGQIVSKGLGGRQAGATRLGCPCQLVRGVVAQGPNACGQYVPTVGPGRDLPHGIVGVTEAGEDGGVGLKVRNLSQPLVRRNIIIRIQIGLAIWYDAVASIGVEFR